MLSSMEGIAHWSRWKENILLYEEELIHRLEGSSYRAYQKYYYIFEKDNLIIKLIDGRVFAQYSLSNIMTDSDPFFCGRDEYRSLFAILNDHEIIQTVWANGSKKTYVIHTTFKN